MTGERVLERMREAVSLPVAQALLYAFYDPHGPFAGATYLEVGENAANAIGIDDLLAVSLLDAPFRPRAVRRLLEDCPSALTEFLAASPTRTLGQGPPFAPGDEAYDVALSAWNVLVSPVVPDAGRARASKLMARKRPKLIPVVDSRIREVVGFERDLDEWQAFDQAMRDDLISGRLAELRGPASVPSLRMLDTLLWMLSSRSKNAKGVRVRVGLAEEAWRPPTQ